MDGLLRGIFVFWLLALAVGLNNVFVEYWGHSDLYEQPNLLAGIVISLYIGATAIIAFITFSRRLRYELRAGIFLSVLYFLGAMGLVLASFSGDGRILFFAFIILSAVFFDFRHSTAALGLTLLTLLIVGYLQLTGRIVVPVSSQVNSTDASAWLSGGIVLLVLSSAALLSINYLLQTFSQSLSDTREKATELSRLYEAAEEMAARIGEPVSLLHALAKHMTESLQATSANIMSFNVSRSSMTVLAEYWAETAGPRERVSDFGREYPVRDFITIVRAVSSGEAITIHSDQKHLTEAERRQFAAYGVKSMLFVPIKSRGELLGDAEIWESRSRREFSPAEIRLVQGIASHAAAIIESARLLAETRQRENELSALLSVSRAVSSSLEIGDVLRMAATSMARLMRSDYCTLSEFDPVTNSIHTIARYVPDGEVDQSSDREVLYPLSDYHMVKRAFETNTPVLVRINDAQADTKEIELLRELGEQSNLIIPLMVGERALGTAELYSSDPHREYSSAEIDLVLALADQIAIAIDNARLYKQMEERESYFRELFENSAEGAAVMDIYGNFTYVSAAEEKILGYEPVGVIGHSFLEIIHPDDVSRVQDAFKDSILRPYAVVQAEYRARNADGSWRDLEISLKNLLDEPAVKGIVANFRDVSERKRAEAALSEREAYYRALIENSAEGFAILNSDGMVNYLAPSEVRLTGYSPEEIIGKSAFQYIHPDDLPMVIKTFEEGLSISGAVRTIHYRLKLKSGEWRYFEIIGQNLLHDPRVSGVVVNYRDITERITAASAIEESEERYRTIFQSAAVPIWEDDYSGLMNLIEEIKKTGAIDFETYINENTDFIKNAAKLIKILDVNEATIRLMEAGDKSELIGPLSRLFSGGWSFPYFAEEVIALANGMRHYEHEAILFTQQGNRRDVWISITLPQWAMGYERVLVSTLDITERKQAERALIESQARLEGIINTALNGIITIDEEQKIVLFNPFAEKIFGYPASNVIGKSLKILLPERYRDGHEKNVGGFGKTHVSSRNHGRLDSLYGLRANGEEFPMEAFISQHQFGNKKFYTVILRDITDRKLAEDTMQRRASELQTLVLVSSALRSAGSVNEIIPLVIRYAVDIVAGDVGTVYLLEESSGNFVSPGWYSVEKGEDIKVMGGATLRNRGAKGITGHVVTTGQIYITEDLQSDPLAVILPPEEEILRKARSGISLPLLLQEKVIGVLHIRLKTIHIFTETEIRLLTAIAEMAGNAIHRATLYEQTQKQADELTRAYDSTLSGWARALELRDELTEGHTRRVTELTLELARSMDLPEGELIQMRRGAILHDIGKMGIPDAILNKTGPLTAQEMRIMKMHPQYAYEMLSSIPFLRSALDIPYSHHEHWDGSGYPRGLKGEEIPLAARIFSVVDVWDALTSDRPYRAAWKKENARQYILDHSGTQFDPRVVEKFISLLDS